MSQQINLLLPELKPRFDWLALPVVASLALAGLLSLVGLSTVTAMRADSLREKEAAIKTQLLALQQQVQTLGHSLGTRQGDSMLDKQIAAVRLGVTQRQEVLNVIGQGEVTGSNAYSGLLKGFSRQGLEGVWLVGFGFCRQGHRNSRPADRPCLVADLYQPPQCGTGLCRPAILGPRHEGF